MVKNPERLVVDLEGIELNSVLESLANKVAADDPNIRLLRAGRYKPGRRPPGDGTQGRGQSAGLRAATGWRLTDIGWCSTSIR
jgi:hypothetical protein